MAKRESEAAPRAMRGVEIRQLDPQIEMTTSRGFRVAGPADGALAVGILDDVGEIVDLACKIFGIGCPGGGNGGGGGGGSGCYTIITPDGTKITICPPQQVAIA